jgi:uncharacterized protein YecT (DUF1311 family)
MPSDRAGEPWAGTTYNGFSGPAEPRPARRATPPLSRNLILGGVAAAVGLGLVFGFAARPNLGQHERAAPMQPATQPSTDTLDIEVNKPVILPAPRPTGRLEVLPPDLARNAPRMAARALPAQPAAAPHIDAPLSPPRIDPRPPTEASFSCRGAGSAAEQMVCEDPGLARADRRLQRAYERALRTGSVPPRELRDDQRDWLAIREDAAHRSPAAVRSVYEQRIDELNALAEDDPG